MPVQKMTGDQSRLLKIGDRVCWKVSATDLGTVVGTTWSGVTIDWDDGHTASSGTTIWLRLSVRRSGFEIILLW